MSLADLWSRLCAGSERVVGHAVAEDGFHLLVERHEPPVLVPTLAVDVSALWRALSFTFPFERPGYPPARPVDGAQLCLSEFYPLIGARELERPLRFLGPLLVSLSAQIADQVPELGEDIRAALGTEAWKAALEAAPKLWAARFVQGDVDPTEVPAKIVFLGEQMIVLEANGERVSFKLSTAGITKSSPALVSGWWRTPAGTRAATVLQVDDRRWTFDFAGKLVGTR